MTNWTIDTAHSNISFSVKHMMVSKVRGSFGDYTAVIHAADLTDLSGAGVEFTIRTASIDTGNEDRDNHLRSADFFDAETFPEIKFRSTHIEKDGDDYKIIGDMTIKDITKPVTFNAEYNGKGTNPWGVDVYAFEAESKLNREDFGLTWNAALETGGVLVGKEIKINLDLQINPASAE